MLMSVLILWFSAAAPNPNPQVHSFGMARGAAAGHSPSSQSVSNQSSDTAIPLAVQDVTYGFQDQQPVDFEGVTWPRKARLKTGDLVMLQPITRNAGEIHPLIAPGPLMTYCQVVGTARGALKGAVCLICWKRSTISKSSNAGLTNAKEHLRTGLGGRATGCKQPAGKERLDSIPHTARTGDAEHCTEPEWTFEEKLPHHVDVAWWLVDNARPEQICRDGLLRKHERNISKGQYNMPHPQTIDRIQEITEFMTFQNLLDAVVRAWSFMHGTLPHMAIYFDSWTSNSNDTYISLDASFFDPDSPSELTNVTLWIFKLKGSHNSNALALAIAKAFKMYGMHAAPLPYEPPQTALAKGQIGQHTDLSKFVRSATTDDGGGVMKNTALELAIKRLWCTLHKLGIPHSWALGQSGTDTTRNSRQQEMRGFMSRMSRMVTHFAGSSQATDTLKEEQQKQVSSWLELVHCVSNSQQLENGTEANLALATEQISAANPGLVLDCQTGRVVNFRAVLLSEEEPPEEQAAAAAEAAADSELAFWQRQAEEAGILDAGELSSFDSDVD
jgi:hypothetical protein